MNTRYIESEGYESDGNNRQYWIYLKPGFKSSADPVGAEHAIVERTKTEAHKHTVMKCQCHGQCYECWT